MSTRDLTVLLLWLRLLQRTTARQDEDPDPFLPAVREIQRGVRVEENYELLWKCLRPGLLRYFIYRNFQLADAEDLCQEVFCKVHKGIHGFAGRSRFKTWVYSIADNVYLNRLRSQAAEMRDAKEVSLSPADDDSPGRAFDPPAAGPSPEDVVAARELLAKVLAVVADFPPQMKRCFYLRVYQELKFQEVALVMNVTLDTVKAHLGEARKRLRLILSEEGAILRRLDENHE